MSTAKSHVPIIEYVDTREGPNSPVTVRIKSANGEIIHATNQRFQDIRDGRRSVQQLQDTLLGDFKGTAMSIEEMISARKMKEKRVKKPAPAVTS